MRQWEGLRLGMCMLFRLCCINKQQGSLSAGGRILLSSCPPLDLLDTPSRASESCSQQAHKQETRELQQRQAQRPLHCTHAYLKRASAISDA